MKKIIIIGFVLLLNMGYSQTKQETIDWLNMKLLEYTDTFLGEYSIETVNSKDWGEMVWLLINATIL